MPTNRKNNKAKEFAIGTRIKYNGKLYEVIESVNCADCSIANICSNSNIDDKTGHGLSVDKRLNIFGECSSFDRYDSKSVVFIEIPMNKSDNINHNIIQPLVEANGTVKDLQIKAPTNFEIDAKGSDLDKGIIRFKRKWLSLEQIYNIAKATNYNTYLSEIKDSKDDKTCEIRDKLIALANLMDIANYFNGDWNYNANGNECGYMIAYDRSIKESYYKVNAIYPDIDVYYGNPVFKNEDDAKYVIDNPNFREVLDKIFKV